MEERNGECKTPPGPNWELNPSPSRDKLGRYHHAKLALSKIPTNLYKKEFFIVDTLHNRQFYFSECGSLFRFQQF